MRYAAFAPVAAHTHTHTHTYIYIYYLVLFGARVGNLRNCSNIVFLGGWEQFQALCIYIYIYIYIYNCVTVLPAIGRSPIESLKLAVVWLLLLLQLHGIQTARMDALMPEWRVSVAPSIVAIRHLVKVLDDIVTLPSWVFLLSLLICACYGVYLIVKCALADLKAYICMGAHFSAPLC